MKLHGKLVQRQHVTDLQRHQMFDLMTTYYANVERETFDADLDEKQWVILVTDPVCGEIRGFSTQTLLRVSVRDEPICALFSGDTIVHHEYWARNPLAQVWGRLALSLIDTMHDVELYWFLITKGYKTYRFLPVFFHEFYPRHDNPTPTWARDVVGGLGRAKFPQSYDEHTGIVRADNAACQLRNHVAQISDDRMRDPHVSFFAERNPGHRFGDELCCVARLTRENFTPAAYRVIGTQELSAVEQ